MKERMSENNNSEQVSRRGFLTRIFGGNKTETPKAVTPSVASTPERSHKSKVGHSRRDFLRRAAVVTGAVIAANATPPLVADAARLFGNQGEKITDPVGEKGNEDGFPPKTGEIPQGNRDRHDKVESDGNHDKREQESKILKLDAVEVADLNPGGTPIFMRKPAEALDSQLFSSVKESINNAVNTTSTFVDNSNDENIKKISNITAVVVGKKDSSQSTPEPQVTPTAPDNNQKFVDVFVTTVGYGFYVKGDNVWFYNNGDVMDVMGVKDVSDPRIQKDFYIFPTKDSKLVAANLTTGETYATGELGDNGKINWTKAAEVTVDTAKIWETSIIPSAEKLGESTGAGITFYLDEMWEKSPETKKVATPKEIQVRDEKNLKVYKEYMIWIALKNNKSDLAGDSFDQFLKNWSTRQQKGEKLTWPLMAIDTKTLKPVKVDVPLGEINFKGNLSKGYDTFDVTGGAQFDVLFTTHSFYKLHPLSYMYGSGNDYEKNGIFVNSDDPTRIMMVDSLEIRTDGSFGLYYNGKFEDGMVVNQLQTCFAEMTLPESKTQDILDGKVGNLNSGGGQHLFSGLYTYPYETLLKARGSSQILHVS